MPLTSEMTFPYFNIGIPQSIKKFEKVTILERFIISKQLRGMREY